MPSANAHPTPGGSAPSESRRSRFSVHAAGCPRDPLLRTQAAAGGSRTPRRSSAFGFHTSAPPGEDTPTAWTGAGLRRDTARSSMASIFICCTAAFLTADNKEFKNTKKYFDFSTSQVLSA